MEVFFDVLTDADAKRSFVKTAVQATLQTVTEMYALCFGKGHNYLWWLSTPKEDGTFPNPDDPELLKK